MQTPASQMRHRAASAAVAGRTEQVGQSQASRMLGHCYCWAVAFVGGLEEDPKEQGKRDFVVVEAGRRELEAESLVDGKRRRPVPVEVVIEGSCCLDLVVDLEVAAVEARMHCSAAGKESVLAGAMGKVVVALAGGQAAHLMEVQMMGCLLAVVADQ